VPVKVTSVPPATGPSDGSTRISNDWTLYSYRISFVVKSTLFVDTSRATLPVLLLGDTHWMCSLVMNLAGTVSAPNLQTSASESTKWTPYTLIVDPPSTGPCLGEIVLTSTWLKYENTRVLLAKSIPLIDIEKDVANGRDTRAATGGLTQEHSVWLRKVAWTILLPNLQLIPVELTKFRPRTMITVFPVEGPTEGTNEFTTTGAKYVKILSLRLKW
jgi:hypothetical protein